MSLSFKKTRTVIKCFSSFEIRNDFFSSFIKGKRTLLQRSITIVIHCLLSRFLDFRFRL